MDERAASLPLQQFDAQVGEEKKRIWNANPRMNWMSKIPIAGTEEKQATETIKEHWVEQGIWKDKWDEMAAGRGYMGVGKWKHEEPLELESESETGTEVESPPPTFSIFGVPQKPPQPKPRRPKSDDEMQQIAERRAIREREREREASRPYYQFIYQISKERERTQDESANGEGADAADINKRAYENIKNTWTKRGIWNGGWGILPGMSWKHEWPLEEEAADDPAPANPFVNGIHEAEEAPTRRIFGSLSPVVSNHRQTSAIMNTTQQGPSAEFGSARLENRDAERSPSASNSPRRHIAGKRDLRPTTGQALRSRGKIPSHKDGQPQPVAASIPPRRSKRLQPPEPNTAKGPTGITSTDSTKVISRSRPKRNGAGNPKSIGSVKPQGVSKKQCSSRARGKARKGGS